ncbi:hypothetical protein, partial [Citrobacter sp. Igbk 16]|uniref:hypothetical protein n=1 Tax=Citrobacter sp. Igbk 16 TaxID=2963958 RepID=UPI0023040448
MSNMLEMAKKQGRDRSDTLLDDNDSHVSNPSESDENEAVAAHENVAQALPQQTLERPQSLQENNAIKKTMSGREIRRLQESSRSPASNSNEMTAQNNEHAVEDDQDTDNIKHHSESVIL